MTMLWWHWFVLGFVLAGIELATPGGFYMLFFGTGALVVGALSLIGLGGPPWLEWLLFALVSVAALLLFRNRLVEYWRHGATVQEFDTLAGEIATVMETLAPGAVGRAELRGTAWSARNDGTVPLTQGQRCVVVGVDGLTLSLVPEGAR